MLYCHNLCHPVIDLLFLIPNYLLFLVYLEQEIDVSFRQQQGGTSPFFDDLHENMVIIVIWSLFLVHTEFSPWCPSNCNF